MVTVRALHPKPGVVSLERLSIGTDTPIASALLLNLIVWGFGVGANAQRAQALLLLLLVYR